MIYLQLFFSFFQIGLFSFGGGYAAMPLIQNQIVDIHGWLSMDEFADVITISQMTPGSIGINSATFIGTRIAGLTGAIVATLGCIFPSCMIVLVLAHVYYKHKGTAIVHGMLKGLHPAVIAMITSAGLDLLVLAFWKENGISAGEKNIDYISMLIFSLSFIILRKWKVNPIAVMIGSGLISLCLYTLFL